MEAKRSCRARWIVCAGCCATVMAGSLFLFCYRDMIALRRIERDVSVIPSQERVGSLSQDNDHPGRERVQGSSAQPFDETAGQRSGLARVESRASLTSDANAPVEPPAELTASIDQVSQDLVKDIVEGYDRRLFGTESSLEKTQAAFAEAFADRDHTLPLLFDLLDKAGEEEKAWIRDALLKRFDSDSDPQVRRVCMVCMVRFGDEARALHVRALATDEDRGIRVLAAYSLGQLGSDQEVGLLMQAVKEDKESLGEGRELAVMAVSALGEIGGKQAALALTELWNNEEWSRGCRDIIINSLGMTGDADSLDLLETTLQGSANRDIRNAALVGVGHLASRNRTDPQVANRAGTLLRSYLQQEDLYTRCIAIRALGWIGGREDVYLLKPFLEDNHSKVVTYSENGQVSEKVVYPVREDAQKAIDEIEARLASG